MINSSCKICGKGFYSKPSHISKGWGKYCSKKCQYQSQQTGSITGCATCSKKIYKNKAEKNRSKSGRLFCSKSCQTIWRNKQYTRDKHPNWSTGQSSYRTVLLREGHEMFCQKCNNDDKRVLAVHHKDKDRNNNSLNNLIWLCHNCHYLVHHFVEESDGFIIAS